MKNTIKKFIPKKLLGLYIQLYNRGYWRYEDLKGRLDRKKELWRNKKTSFLIKNNCKLRKNFKIGMAVLAHERAEYLEACLDSLFRTKLHNYDITFLIQDDGSKDPRVKELINKKRDPKYKIVRYFTRKGHNSWAGAFNKAVRKLTEIDNFDIIGTCDSDCLFHPEWLDKTMKIALWAKRHHKKDILGPFSSFNSDQWEFHNILGTYKSPYGNFVVKERMGALNYFYFKKDLVKLGFYEESKDDETLMTEKFKNLEVRYFCTEKSYVEHLGRMSILDKWRPVAVGEKNFTFAAKPIIKGWDLPQYIYKRFPYLRHRIIVLEIKHGGLGDHLFYSHLPKIAKESGFDKVYISNYSEYRHPDYKKLIWKLNPYIDGFCDEKGYQPNIQKLDFDMNLLDKVMLEMGLDDKKRFHEPKIYYKPKIKRELASKIIYDPNFVANAGESITPKIITEYFVKHKVKVDYQMKLRDRSVPLLNAGGVLETKNLEDFCDMIASCNKIYCLASGTATLCAALGKRAVVFCGKNVKSMFRHSKLHHYIEM